HRHDRRRHQTPLGGVRLQGGLELALLFTPWPISNQTHRPVTIAVPSWLATGPVIAVRAAAKVQGAVSKSHVLARALVSSSRIWGFTKSLFAKAHKANSCCFPGGRTAPVFAYAFGPPQALNGLAVQRAFEGLQGVVFNIL